VAALACSGGWIHLWRLRLICEQKLCTYINTSSAAVLALAEQHHCQGLKEARLDFLKVHGNLQEVMVLGGLDHLTSSCPSVFKELIARLVSPSTDD
jgi:speckle-type POZ protein